VLIIPEIETVVILVPRTGSGSLHKAVLGKYPKATLLYRHMEADGVPAGYDRWNRVGIARDPLDKLWSMYKFCKTFGGTPSYDPTHAERIRRSVDCSFDDWVLHNEVVFATQYHHGTSEVRSPHFNVLHNLPENKKSQFVYLRPDLGTEVWHYDDKHALAARLGVELGHRNATDPVPVPIIELETQRHIENVFRWDLRSDIFT
jgi:hypothetical protein